MNIGENLRHLWTKNRQLRLRFKQNNKTIIRRRAGWLAIWIVRGWLLIFIRKQIDEMILLNKYFILL
jgi:hypothetical protein